MARYIKYMNVFVRRHCVYSVVCRYKFKYVCQAKCQATVMLLYIVDDAGRQAGKQAVRQAVKEATKCLAHENTKLSFTNTQHTTTTRRMFRWKMKLFRAIRVKSTQIVLLGCCAYIRVRLCWCPFIRNAIEKPFTEWNGKFGEENMKQTDRKWSGNNDAGERKIGMNKHVLLTSYERKLCTKLKVKYTFWFVSWNDVYVISLNGGCSVK